MCSLSFVPPRLRTRLTSDSFATEAEREITLNQMKSMKKLTSVDSNKEMEALAVLQTILARKSALPGQLEAEESVNKRLRMGPLPSPNTSRVVEFIKTGEAILESPARVVALYQNWAIDRDRATNTMYVYIVLVVSGEDIIIKATFTTIVDATDYVRKYCPDFLRDNTPRPEEEILEESADDGRVSWLLHGPDFEVRVSIEKCIITAPELKPAKS